MYVSNQTTLFDYINNPEAAKNTLDNLAHMPSKAQAAQDIRSLGEAHSDAGIQETLDKIDAGDTSVSLSTIGNMLEHYKSKVSADLQDIAGNLDAPLTLTKQNDRWMLALPEGQTDAKALSRIQQYIDKDHRLTDTLSQINQLAEMHELGTARTYADTLKSSGVDDDDIVTFLSNTREQIFSEDSLQFVDGKLAANSENMAKSAYESLTDKQ